MHGRNRADASPDPETDGRVSPSLFNAFHPTIALTPLDSWRTYLVPAMLDC
jgi:hypothetical protein